MFVVFGAVFSCIRSVCGSKSDVVINVVINCRNLGFSLVS